MDMIDISFFLSIFLFSTGYLGLYIAYVLTVIVSAYIYNRQKHQLNGSAQTTGREQGKETAVFLSTDHSTLFLPSFISLHFILNSCMRSDHFSFKVKSKCVVNSQNYCFY